MKYININSSHSRFDKKLTVMKAKEKNLGNFLEYTLGTSTPLPSKWKDPKSHRDWFAGLLNLILWLQPILKPGIEKMPS